MNITEIRVQLAKGTASGLVASCSVTFDDELVVHEVKIIETFNHRLVVSMPAKSVMIKCEDCWYRNPFAQRYCGGCGKKRPYTPIPSDERRYFNMAHPINSDFRYDLEEAILEAYHIAIDTGCCRTTY